MFENLFDNYLVSEVVSITLKKFCFTCTVLEGQQEYSLAVALGGWPVLNPRHPKSKLISN